jgi:transposase
MGRFDLTDKEWEAIKPHLPDKVRGIARVDDRRVLNGIFRILRSGARYSDLPERHGPVTTIYNRFQRWRKAGVRDRLMDAIVAAHDGQVQMIDSSIVRVRQHGAAAKRGGEIDVRVVPEAASPPRSTPSSTKKVAPSASSSARARKATSPGHKS